MQPRQAADPRHAAAPGVGPGYETRDRVHAGLRAALRAKLENPGGPALIRPSPGRLPVRKRFVSGRAPPRSFTVFSSPPHERSRPFTPGSLRSGGDANRDASRRGDVRKRWKLFGVLLLMVLAVTTAACGDDDDTTAAGGGGGDSEDLGSIWVLLPDTAVVRSVGEGRPPLLRGGVRGRRLRRATTTRSSTPRATPSSSSPGRAGHRRRREGDPAHQPRLRVRRHDHRRGPRGRREGDRLRPRSPPRATAPTSTSASTTSRSARRWPRCSSPPSTTSARHPPGRDAQRRLRPTTTPRSSGRATTATVEERVDAGDWEAGGRPGRARLGQPAGADGSSSRSSSDADNDVDAVFAANDGLAGSAITALKAAGLDPIPISGQDATAAGIQNILAGTQTMTVYKPIKAEAEAAAAAAIALRNGEDVDRPVGRLRR